jgi:hypothetical protein
MIDLLLEVSVSHFYDCNRGGVIWEVRNGSCIGEKVSDRGFDFFVDVLILIVSIERRRGQDPS